MRFEPVNDFVLVEPAESIKETDGGILLPEMARDLPVEGIVIAIGPGRFEFGRLVPTEVAVGDRIKFGKWAGTDISLDGRDYRVMREEEILGIMEHASVPDATGDCVSA